MNIKVIDYPKESFLYNYCQKVFEKRSNSANERAQINHVQLVPSKYNFKCIQLKETEEALNIVVKLMTDNGFKITDKKLNDSVFGEDDPEINVLIELHYSKCQDEKVHYPFEYHQDDHGGINCNVNTCIVYFDVDCDGGELAFKECEDPDEPPEELIDVNSGKDTVKIVIFRGDLTHGAMPYRNGHRYLLSFQIERKD